MEPSTNHSGEKIKRAFPPEATAAEAGRREELEAALGYRFAKKELLDQALTHRSLLHERRTQEQGLQDPDGSPKSAADNERLEFLGDAVVGMVTAESLYQRYPELPEGSLTRLRASLVSRRYLAEVAEGLQMGRYLRLGRGEERSGGRAKMALLANAMEAVIGAVFLDAGLDAARGIVEAQVIAPQVAGLRERLTGGSGMGDFKSALQELLQARRQGQPEYRTTAESGPDHRKRFFVEARVAGQALAEGAGPTRKFAEQDAARRAIEKLQSLSEAGEKK